MNSRARGPSGLRPEFVLRYTASVINIDPVVSGKHIGVSQLAQARSEHPYEKMVDACSVYRFNSYERRCKGVPASTRSAPSHNTKRCAKRASAPSPDGGRLPGFRKLFLGGIHRGVRRSV